MKNKEELIHILRHAERNFSKAMILIEDEKKMHEVEHRIKLLKKSIVNLMFDIEETK